MTEPWRCFTVRQWWAWAIAYGGKGVDNRAPGALKWKHRGRTGIHAAKAADERLRGRLNLAYRPNGLTWADMVPPVPTSLRFASETELARVLAAAGPDSLRALEVYSAVIATANLVDIHQAAGGCCAPWGEEFYVDPANPTALHPATHVVFKDVRPVWPPIDCSGRLGIWTPTPEVVTELDQL